MCGVREAITNVNSPILALHSRRLEDTILFALVVQADIFCQNEIQIVQASLLGSILANLLLIPAAMFVILGGVASLLCSLAGFSPGSELCNHATGMVLWVMDWLVQWLAELPGGHWPATFVAPWAGPAALTALMGVILVAYSQGWSRRTGSWWLPFVVVALTLIFGVKFG